MDVTLPLDQMTVQDKLRVIERIRENLTRDESAVPSPRWHRDILEKRENAISNGNDGFTGWEESKKRIRESTR